MKKYTFLFLSFLCLWSACKEEPIFIPPFGQGTPVVTSGERNILVEEFTGVKCVNCPDGAAEIENLKTKYGERLVAVSIHAGFFAKKLAESKYDFKTAQGTSILNLLGEPEGYPAIVIDRKPLGANNKFAIIGLGQWAGLISTESKEKAKAKLEVKNVYTDATRELKVTVNITPSELLSGTHHLSIMLTENNIIDAQTKPNVGVVTDYNHKHVLRDMLTNYDGLPLSETLANNVTIKKEFTYTVPANFKVKDCEVIAILHKSGASKEVVEAAAKKIQ